MDDNTVHIGTDKQTTGWWRWFTKPVVWIPLVVIVLAVGGWITYSTVKKHNDQKAANERDKKYVLSNLESTMQSSDNPKGIIYIVDRLLAGQKAGTYVIDQKEQSKLYLDRAAANINLKDYKKAVDDYNKAAALDATNKLPALQGAVEARYMLGERKQLIPVYQELLKLEEKSEDPMRGSVVAQYQQNIETLQQGGELGF